MDGLREEKKNPAGVIERMIDKECLRERVTNAGPVRGRKVGQGEWECLKEMEI